MAFPIAALPLVASALQLGLQVSANDPYQKYNKDKLKKVTNRLETGEYLTSEQEQAINQAIAAPAAAEANAARRRAEQIRHGALAARGGSSGLQLQAGMREEVSERTQAQQQAAAERVRLAAMARQALEQEQEDRQDFKRQLRMQDYGAVVGAIPQITGAFGELEGAVPGLFQNAGSFGRPYRKQVVWPTPATSAAPVGRVTQPQVQSPAVAIGRAIAAAPSAPAAPPPAPATAPPAPPAPPAAPVSVQAPTAPVVAPPAPPLPTAPTLPIKGRKSVRTLQQNLGAVDSRNLDALLGPPDASGSRTGTGGMLEPVLQDPVLFYALASQIPAMQESVLQQPDSYAYRDVNVSLRPEELAQFQQFYSTLDSARRRYVDEVVDLLITDTQFPMFYSYAKLFPSMQQRILGLPPGATNSTYGVDLGYYTTLGAPPDADLSGQPTAGKR